MSKSKHESPDMAEVHAAQAEINVERDDLRDPPEESK